MERQVQELWHEVLSMIQKKISKPSFDTWLKSTKAVSLQDNILVIGTPNTFTQEWLENRYAKLISDAVRECLQVRPELPHRYAG
ncbi:DnaA N-terminal domain-containing protein [Paenibacillus sp. JTLBN-2024]